MNASTTTNYLLRRNRYLTIPEKWKRSWLHLHKRVNNLTSVFRQSCSIVVLSCISAGFPNVILNAFEAGRGIVVHKGFPFEYLPISDEWRFSLLLDNKANCARMHRGHQSELENLLDNLLREKRDFKRDNVRLVKLMESDWEK